MPRQLWPLRLTSASNGGAWELRSVSLKPVLFATEPRLHRPVAAAIAAPSNATELPPVRDASGRWPKDVFPPGQHPADAHGPRIPDAPDDADLIALCAQLDALEREYLATNFNLMPGTPEDDAAEAERARIAEAQQPLVDAICARPPQTVAGAVAVAHSLALWDGDLFRQGGPDGYTNERLVAVLVRGLTGRAGA